MSFGIEKKEAKSVKIFLYEKYGTTIYMFGIFKIRTTVYFATQIQVIPQ